MTLLTMPDATGSSPNYALIATIAFILILLCIAAFIACRHK
jgi:hypothetical protein